MENKQENEPAFVREAKYKPLRPEYKPYKPTKAQARKLERFIKKKRS